MNDDGHDLNSNMLPISSAQNHAGGTRQISLLNPSNIAVRRNLTREVRQNISDSVNYNIGLVFFAILKVIASVIVLFITNSDCDKPLRQWVLYMILHDVLYSSTLVLKAKTILRHTFIRERFMEEYNNQTREEEQPDGRDVFGYHIHNDDSVFTISDVAERKNRIVSALTAICKTYYYAIFIYAQILYFHTETTCPTEPPTLINLIMVYIGFGYVYIGMPVVFIILACLCLPFLLFFSYLFARGEQVPVTKETMKKLTIISYNSETPGNNECSICMAEYKEGDKLIQLKCSPMHHYHEDCLKKWLKINGLCPICRARIEEEKPRKSGDVELANTILSQN